MRDAVLKQGREWEKEGRDFTAIEMANAVGYKRNSVFQAMQDNEQHFLPVTGPGTHQIQKRRGQRLYRYKDII